MVFQDLLVHQENFHFIHQMYFSKETVLAEISEKLKEGT